MKTVTLEVASREEVTRRALEALRGKKQRARISFATPELLWKVLTAKRWELLKAMAGVNIVYVAYRGTPQAFTDLIGGQTQLMMVPPALAVPQVKTGRLKALAVTTSDPSALAPGLPTVAASGLPGYEAISMQVMFAPANTPATIINRLNQESVRVVNSAEAKERVLNFGLEAVASSPEQLAAAMKSEMAKLGKVIKDAGIKME